MSGKKKKSVASQDDRKPRKPDGHKARGGKPADWERAFWRYAAITTVMSVMFVLYKWHPYYNRNQFRPWHPVFETAYWGWVALGVPYVMVTLQKFGGRRMDFTDGAVHWGLLFRGISHWVLEGCRWPSHIARNRRMKNTMLSLGVKGFFTPLMTIFFSEHASNIRNMWLRQKGVEIPTDDFLIGLSSHDLMGNVDAWWGYLSDLGPRVLPTLQDVTTAINVSAWGPGGKYFAMDLYYQLLFFVDCGWALFGYAAESRWFGNKTKSVEPTGFGWMVALMCYPPFNDVSGTYFPLGKGPQIFPEDWALLCRVLMLVAFTVYVSATLAFGPTFSNLTNRGIVTRGPYAFIRHPAYAAKNFAWWMEYLPFLQSSSTVLWLVAWNIIYGLRAWTEERHLGRDPAYREYKKKVKWAAIPGVF